MTGVEKKGSSWSWGHRDQILEGLNWHLVVDITGRKGFATVNFMCQLDQAIGCPDIGQILF